MIKRILNWNKPNKNFGLIDVAVKVVIFFAVLLVLAIVIGIYAMSQYVLSPDFTKYVNDLLQPENPQNKIEVLSFLGLGIGGLIAFFGLVVFGIRAGAQIKLNQLTEKGLSQDRLKAAVEHLASKEESARIASFYEFFYLARDERDYAQNILGILCAHLRHISNAISENHNQEKPTEEVKTLVGILFSKEAQDVFDGLDYDLQRANLTKVNFRNMNRPTGKVDFSHANLSEVNFWNADVSNFVFEYATLHNTNFSGAIMHGVIMAYAKLKGTSFYEAKMQKSILPFLELESPESDDNFTSFHKAELQGAMIWSKNFKNAHWGNANFDNADLRLAELQGAYLVNVKNLETAELSGAEHDDNTKFPDGFSVPSGMRKVPVECPVEEDEYEE